MLKLVSSFSFTIFIAILSGIATGGFPRFGTEIATASLILAMIFSISNISFKVNFKEETKEILLSLMLNYGFLSSIIIAMGYIMRDYFEGFIVMASAPPAVAIVPLTSILKGDKKHSLFSLIFLYLASIILMPLIIFIFLSEKVEFSILIKNVLMLILFPIIVSRIFYRKINERYSKIITNICFFLIVFSVIGKNRQFIFEDYFILIPLSALMFIRTFVTSTIIKKFSTKIFGEERAVSHALFSSFKNEGLIMIIASSLFSYSTALPAIVALIFEMILICCMEAKMI